jgi:hypothetical protein
MGGYLFAVVAFAACVDLFRRMFTSWHRTTPRWAFVDALAFVTWDLATGASLFVLVIPLAWPLLVMYSRPEAWPSAAVSQTAPPSWWDRLGWALFLYMVAFPLINVLLLRDLPTSVATLAFIPCVAGLVVFRGPLVWLVQRAIDP